MECQGVKNLLSEYLEGDLSDLQKAQVNQHLSSCKDCAAELETLKRLVKGLGSLKKVTAPPDLLDGIHRQLGKKAFLSRFKVPLEAAGVLASIILVVLFINQLGIVKKEGRSGLMKAKAGSSAGVKVETETFSSVGALRELPETNAFTTSGPEAPAMKGLYYRGIAAPKISAREAVSGGEQFIFQHAEKEYDLKSEMPSEQRMTVITAKTNEDVAKVKTIVKELEGEVEREEANNLYIKIPAKNVPALFDQLKTADRESVAASPAAEELVHLDIQFPEKQ